MSFKTIVVLLNDIGQTQRLLEASSALARQHDAHLIGLYVIPAAQVYSDAGMSGMPILFEGYRDLFKSKRDAIKTEFEAKTKLEGLRMEWREVDSTFPEIAPGAIFNARSADVIITSQGSVTTDSNGIERNITERLIMESGRPVLVVPRTGQIKSNATGKFEKVVIGVNGTRESARAMFDVLPLLRHSKETRLVWVDPYLQPDDAGQVPGAEEAAVLTRHGFKTIAEPMMTDGRNAGEALLLRANDLGSDLLVMGAYGHSRMREFIFGGASRYVLEHMTIPVLMSH